MNYRLIPLDSIVVKPGRRTLGDLSDLMESITSIGLLNPITVTTDHRLVAGASRLAACQRLGWLEIPAHVVTLDDIEAELAQIDENLIRNELTVLQRGEQLLRRRELYLARYPQTKRGGAPGKAGGGKKAKTEIISAFADDVAAKTSVTSRTVRQEIQIARGLAEPVKERIRGTVLEDNKVELLRLARRPVEQQRRIVEAVVRDGNLSVRRAEIALAAAAIVAEPPALPTGPFRVLVVDPPWQYTTRESDASHRGTVSYPCLSLEEIKALPVGNLAAEDCVLWLWATNAHIFEVPGLLQAWGFQHKTILTWVKDRIGAGNWLRGQTEHCVMAVRGKPTITCSNQSTVIHAQRREHSRKPEEFYRLVESLCPGSKCELFAREQRSGWVSYGNQTTLFGVAG
jgi:N6-adenosine-specific RNA methylase IME4